MPTLVVSLVMGMNQNQPCSNQKMVMLPSAEPSLRLAWLKWPYTAELLCLGLRCLILKRLARKVSRPEASTTKRGCHSTSRPSSYWACTVEDGREVEWHPR